MRKILLPLIFIFCSWQIKDRIVLKTHSGDTVNIINDRIYFDNRPISDKIDDIVYESNYNRIIEQDSTIFLFLEIDGRPNLNRIEAYKVTPKKAIKLVDCVYNDKSQGIGPAPFTDMDHDGKLEFGGFDLTEYYESKDSMYYNPSEYYEISDGTIKFDSILTKRMDIKINGTHLSHPLDKDGFCCVVIKIPMKKSSR